MRCTENTLARVTPDRYTVEYDDNGTPSKAAVEGGVRFGNTTVKPPELMVLWLDGKISRVSVKDNKVVEVA